jgi:hypothetical protein
MTLDDRPVCALCGHAGRGETAEHHMTHGVSVWLCPPHRTAAFLRRRCGRTFTARLEAIWRANGIATSRRLAALHAHRRRMARPSPRALPGSYSWPLMRREAERRFAAGDAPGDVISDLRGRHDDLPATVPSVRTMRRWFTQARWLTTEPNPTTRRWRPRRSSLPELPPGFMRDPIWPLSEWWIDDT